MSTAAVPLDGMVADLARRPVILVACDYDGTLAPIVDDPAAARPDMAAMAALRELAALPDTHVAVVSGRSLRDLADLSGLEGEVSLVGSHGLEFDDGVSQVLTDEQIETREEVTGVLEDIAARFPGALTETKPAGVAFHYRNVDPLQRDAVRDEVLDGPAARPDVHLKTGKMVVELAVTTTHKGEALDRLRRGCIADAVLFVGDDVTDEDAFAALCDGDVGVKVGPGDTAAIARIDDVSDVSVLLESLARMRREWSGARSDPAG